MRVLLLDDEPSAAALREAMRARPDAELRRAPAATSGVAALVDAERPQVVILGPVAAGRPDVAGVIATLAERIPVVAVGERDRAAAAEWALKAGATDYVALGARDLAARVAHTPSRRAGPRHRKDRRAHRRQPARRTSPGWWA